MAAESYRSGPAGKTPEATLFSALVREITTNGGRSRFKKPGRGQFALNAGARATATRRRERPDGSTGRGP